MTPRPDDALDPALDPAQLEQVVEATRVIGGLIASGSAGLDPPLSTAQWRVLVLASPGGCNVSAVAADLGVHISNATRVCDRLTRLGLLELQRSPHDRRHKLLVLTPAGRRAYEEAMDDRRRRLAAAMARMRPRDRADLARCLSLLTQAVEESHDEPAATATQSAP